MTTPRRAPRVLITNDDGPPSPNSSPFVYPFAQALAKELGWEVKVVLPSTQKSWCVSSPCARLNEADEDSQGWQELPDCSDDDRRVLLPRGQGRVRGGEVSTP